MDNKRPPQGYSLIEVLIASIILLIGLLGLTRAHFYSLYYSRNALLHSIAVTQIANLAEYWLHNHSVSSLMLQRWNQENAVLLPRGAAEVHATGNQLQVKLYWDGCNFAKLSQSCQILMTIP